jgi:hypothetical protein
LDLDLTHGILIITLCFRSLYHELLLSIALLLAAATADAFIWASHRLLSIAHGSNLLASRAEGSSHPTIDTLPSATRSFRHDWRLLADMFVHS